MASLDDVRRIALALPETAENSDRFAFAVAGRGFVWLWQERTHPKRPRVPNPEVIAMRIAHELDKATLIEMAPAIFFTEPHYDGYAAILVRLSPIPLDLLETILADGWRSRAPKRLLAPVAG